MKLPILALLFLSSVFMLNTACKTKAKAQKEADALKISLSQGGCYGTCPIYTMELLPDGSATYVGKQYAPYKGKHVAEIPAEIQGNVRGLAADVLAKADVLPREIVSNIADLPRSVITIQSATDSVVFMGDAEFAPEVAKLREALLEVATNSAWQRAPDAEPLPANQLLVTLQAPDQIQVVTEDFYRQQLKMERLVSKDPAVFLMSFDPYTMSAGEMVRELSRKKMVLNVEIVENK